MVLVTALCVRGIRNHEIKKQQVGEMKVESKQYRTVTKIFQGAEEWGQGCT